MHAVAVSPSAVLGIPAFAPGQAVALDFTSSRFRVGVNGAQTGSFTALTGASFTSSTGGYAQTAAGVLKSFAANTPRITDQGVLIEAAATNLLPWSQDFTQGVSLFAMTSVSGQSGAPDGSATMSRITSAASTAVHAATKSGIGNQTIPATASIYAKSNGFRFLQVGLDDTGSNGGQANIDLLTGTVGTVGLRGAGANYSAAATVLPAGIIKITLTGTINTGGFTSGTLRVGCVQVASLTDAWSPNTTGDGSSGYFVWGAQLEQASTASSPITTTTAAATRSADAASITYSPNGSSAAITFATSGTASPSPTSPINFGASSAGAWVGGYLKTLMVTP